MQGDFGDEIAPAAKFNLGSEPQGSSRSQMWPSQRQPITTSSPSSAIRNCGPRETKGGIRNYAECGRFTPAQRLYDSL
jgi:hypothetical protein